MKVYYWESSTFLRNVTKIGIMSHDGTARRIKNGFMTLALKINWCLPSIVYQGFHNDLNSKHLT